MTIEAMYEAACARPSDINEHLPLLRKIAEECEHVTEMGTRWATGSTIAFLAAQPREFITWDFDPYAIVSQQIANLMAVRGKTFFQPRCGSTLTCIIEPTDLLFIDTLHTQKQLTAELERHADPRAQTVRKYLAFHDTSTFGMVGEDGSEPGLIMAVRHFQKNHAFPLWTLYADHQNNNGLIVLKHVCADGHGEMLGVRCTVCGQIPLPPP